MRSVRIEPCATSSNAYSMQEQSRPRAPTAEFLNRPLGRGGRGEVERFVRLVNHEDVVQRGPNLARMLVHVSI